MERDGKDLMVGDRSLPSRLSKLVGQLHCSLLPQLPKAYWYNRTRCVELLCTQTGWESKIKMEDLVSPWDQQCLKFVGM